MTPPKRRRNADSARPSPKPRPGGREADDRRQPVGLRIIGGSMRGRKLHYSGDMGVRPMKDRVREALFNLLGPAVRGKHALDLFAGTGALGFEAVSRGAQRATFIERHYPTAAVIRANLAELAIQEKCELVTANVFFWARQNLPTGPMPWVVFFSPPYAFYVDRAAEMLQLIEHVVAAAPPDSLVAVESDERFDFSQLPDAAAWDVRPYPPAIVGVYAKP